MHPWHDVSPGPAVPERLHAIVEIARGSRAKYEVDKPSGLLRLDRVLYGAMAYPVNYGFIPQTLGEDGDPLDILVLSQVDILPRTLVTARVIGIMRMIDQGEADDKIIAVAEKDMAVADYQSLDDLPTHWRLELDHFFEQYTVLEGKKVSIDAFEGVEVASQVVHDALVRYNQQFPQRHDALM